jgi:hypothetical protein
MCGYIEHYAEKNVRKVYTKGSLNSLAVSSRVIKVDVYIDVAIRLMAFGRATLRVAGCLEGRFCRVHERRGWRSRRREASILPLFVAKRRILPTSTTSTKIASWRVDSTRTPRTRAVISQPVRTPLRVTRVMFPHRAAAKVSCWIGGREERGGGCDGCGEGRAPNHAFDKRQRPPREEGVLLTRVCARTSLYSRAGVFSVLFPLKRNLCSGCFDAEVSELKNSPRTFVASGARAR